MGLLAPAARSDGDYRLYDPSDVDRLRFIKSLRDDAGFSLAQIGQMLEDEAARARNRERLAHTSDPPSAASTSPRREARVERQIALLEGKAGRLAAMIDDANARLDPHPAGPRPTSRVPSDEPGDRKPRPRAPSATATTDCSSPARVSLIGTWMQAVAQAWLVLQLTSDPLGWASWPPPSSSRSSSSGCSPGSTRTRCRSARRSSRPRRSMAPPTILAVLAFSDTATIPLLILVLALLIGTVNAVDMPVRQAFAVEMVGREDIGNAVALNSAMFNGARVIGPAVAGIASGWSASPGLHLNGLSFLAVIVAPRLMRDSELQSPARIARPESVADVMVQLREGLSYVRRTPIVLMSLLVSASCPLRHELQRGHPAARRRTCSTAAPPATGS